MSKEGNTEENLNELKALFEHWESKLKVAQGKYNADCREIQNTEAEIAKMEDEIKHINELSHHKDAQVKSLHHRYVKRRTDYEDLRQTYSLLLEKEQSCRKLLGQLVVEPEILKDKFSQLLNNQEQEFANQKNIYQCITWAKSYKISHDENVAVRDELDNMKRTLNDEKKKFNDYENELLAMSRNDYPWTSVCIQFSELMLKNMQMKKDIFDADFKIATHSKNKEVAKKEMLEKANRARAISAEKQKLLNLTNQKPSPEPVEIDVDLEPPKKQHQQQYVLKPLGSPSAPNCSIPLAEVISSRRSYQPQDREKDDFVSQNLEIEEPWAKKAKMMENMRDEFELVKQQEPQNQTPDQQRIAQQNLPPPIANCHNMYSKPATPKSVMPPPPPPTKQHVDHSTKFDHHITGKNLFGMNVEQEQSTSCNSGSTDGNESQHNFGENLIAETSYGFNVPLASMEKQQDSARNSPTDFLHNILGGNDNNSGNSGTGNFFNPFAEGQAANTSSDNDAGNVFNFFGNLAGSENPVADSGFTFSFNMNQTGQEESNNGQKSTALGFSMFNFS